MTVRRSLAILLATMMLPFMLSACSDDEGDGAKAQPQPQSTQTDGDAVSLPPIYVKQKTVRVHGGQPAIESGYKKQLGTCRKVPNIKVVPIPDDAVGKLGRSIYQFWYQGRFLKGHSVTWSYDLAKDTLCTFRLIKHVRGYILNDRGAYSIDWDAGVAHWDEEADYVPQAAPPVLSDAERAEEKRKDVAELRQMGRDDMADMLKARHVVKKQVAGQPGLCTTDPLTNARLCTWSGGTQWGFDSESAGSADEYYSSYVVGLVEVGALMVPTGGLYLSVTPPSDGDGYKLETLSMTVEKPFQDDEFALPPNLKVKKDEPNANG